MRSPVLCALDDVGHVSKCVCDHPLCVEDTLESVCQCVSHVSNMYALCNIGCAGFVAAIMYS